MSTKFTDHSAKVLAAVTGAKAKGLAAMGETQNSIWTQEINQRGIVDTGRFQGSPSKAVQEDSVIVGTDVEYSTYLELGTNKMTARPSLRPSVVNHTAELKTAFSGPFKAIK